MRDNPAFIRAVAYIRANNTTLSQIESASDAQVMLILYPDTDGDPGDNHVNKAFLLLALPAHYRAQKVAARVAAIRAKLALIGYALDEWEEDKDDNSWTLKISKAGG